MLCGLTALVIATGWRLFDTYWGDPAIYLPYAKNAAHGDFFSFNPHQFSSGTTSILWQLLLAIPFAIGTGLAGVKVFSIAATVVSVLTVAWAVRRFTSSWFAASLATTFVAGSIALWGALDYDSPLNVAAVASSAVAVKWAANSRRITGRSYLRLAAVWGLLLASRPDSIIVVGAELVALLVATRSQGRRRAILLPAAAIAGAVPSLVYYGYSWLVLGSPSAATQARSFELAEAASHWHGLHYSPEALSYLNSISLTLAAATIGLLRLLRQGSTRVVGATGLAVIAVYVPVIVAVTPVTFFVERYLLPMSPFVAVGLAAVLQEAGRRLAPSHYSATIRGAATSCAAMIALIVVLAGLGLSAARPYGAAVKASQADDTIDAVVERSAVDVVNRAAAPHATLLDYEVQDRYDLRSDLNLLALSGLTDGKVVPYLRRRELLPFLRRYRPSYWIVADAILQRPSIAESDLGRVYATLKDHPKMRALTRGGIRFRVIARRNLREIPGGWWRLILRIDYPGPT